MLLRDHLRLLMAPGRDQWKPMLMGLALSAAAAGAAVLSQPSPISLLLLILALGAWFVGACGMVGYVRWFFAGEFARAREDGAALSEKKQK
jgi:Tfp pilus assembly protein PilN